MFTAGTPGARGSTLAHYRAGEFGQAIRRFTASLEDQPVWDANVCNWLGLAMPYGRLGQREEARRWADKATGWVDHPSAESLRLEVGAFPEVSEHDGLASRLFRREAEPLIGGPPAKP